MENSMIGKNAWGLEIRPCDKGSEIDVYKEAEVFDE